MKIIGLTGSIATGKSAAARHIAARGIPVFDADRFVHELYKTPEIIEWMTETLPEAVINGEIDRRVLGKAIGEDFPFLKILENKIHPLVQEASREFINQAKAGGETRIVLDIPLLYETGREAEMDHVIVIAADKEAQKQRMRQRRAMTDEEFDLLLSRQLPLSEKIKRADFVIHNNGTLDELYKEIDKTLSQL